MKALGHLEVVELGPASAPKEQAWSFAKQSNREVLPDAFGSNHDACLVGVAIPSDMLRELVLDHVDSYCCSALEFCKQQFCLPDLLLAWEGASVLQAAPRLPQQLAEIRQHARPVLVRTGATLSLHVNAMVHGWWRDVDVQRACWQLWHGCTRESVYHRSSNLRPY